MSSAEDDYNNTPMSAIREMDSMQKTIIKLKEENNTLKKGIRSTQMRIRETVLHLSISKDSLMFTEQARKGFEDTYSYFTLLEENIDKIFGRLEY